MSLAELRAYIIAHFADNGTADIDALEMRTALLTLCERIEAEGSWQPILALVGNGPLIVLKVLDWTGGQGVKPAVNVYASTTGYVADINQATNLRGPQGLDGLPGTGIVSVATTTTNPAVQYFPVLELPATTGGTYDFAEFEVVVKPWDSGAYLPARIRVWIANRGAFQYQWSIVGLIADYYNVVVYRLADGRAVAYLKLDNIFKSASVRVINHNQATIYSSLIGQATVTGTKVFDSFDIATYPPVMRQIPTKTTLPALDVLGPVVVRSTGGNLDQGTAFSISVDGLSGDPRALIIGAFTNGKAFLRSVSSSGTPGLEIYVVNTKVVDIDTSGKVGIGITPTEKLDVDGRIRSKGLLTTGALPTIAKGAGVGSGTAALVTDSNDVSGAITLTTSGSPLSNDTICNVTFTTPYARAPRIQITANNAQSANAITRIWAETGTNGFSLYSALTALDNGQSYKYSYLIIV